MNETEVVKKIQAGDMNAFEEIFEIYKNQAIRYAYLITNNKFTSEDIVQETFVKCKYKLKEQIAETDKNFKLNTDDYAIMDYFERSNQPSEVQKILDATKIIHKSKQIIFLGIGTSGILAKYASRCFVNIGRFAVYIDYPYFLVPDGFYDEIVIIVFSVTGETEDIINQLRQFRNFDCVIISITNSEMSTIAKLSDLVISYYLPLQIKGEKKVNLTSQIPVMNIIEKLTFHLSQLECNNK